MKPHYSEADLLETYYTQPGESMPVMMHLADCGECAARYEALDRKLREAAACDTERAETFWTRQRMSIMRRVARQARSGRTATPTLRVAAALTLVAVLSGFAAWRATTQGRRRGSGVTMASGSGSCGSALASMITDRVDRRVNVHLVYGTLTIEWAEDGYVYQEGPATEVFTGIWPS